jgi:hypothetical protein
LAMRRDSCDTAWFAQETNGVPRESSDSLAMWHRHRRTGPNFRLLLCAACWTSPPAGTTSGAVAFPRSEIETTRCSPRRSGRFTPPHAAPTAPRASTPSYGRRASGLAKSA